MLNIPAVDADRGDIAVGLPYNRVGRRSLSRTKESALLGRVQPVRHRPPAPPLMENRGVTHYVVQMFNRGIRHGMELMKSMCAPTHRIGTPAARAVCAKSVSSAPYP